jgi:hypothetical protein
MALGGDKFIMKEAYLIHRLNWGWEDTWEDPIGVSLTEERAKRFVTKWNGLLAEQYLSKHPRNTKAYAKIKKGLDYERGCLNYRPIRIM